MELLPILISAAALALGMLSLVFKSGWHLVATLEKSKAESYARQDVIASTAGTAIESLRRQFTEHEKWCLQEFARRSEMLASVSRTERIIEDIAERIDKRFDETRDQLAATEERIDKRVARIEETIDDFFKK